MSTQCTMRIIFKILCEFFDSVIYCNLVCFTIFFQIYISALHFEPFKRRGDFNSTSSSLSYYNFLYNDIFFWAVVIQSSSFLSLFSRWLVLPTHYCFSHYYISQFDLNFHQGLDIKPIDKICQFLVSESHFPGKVTHLPMAFFHPLHREAF